MATATMETATLGLEGEVAQETDRQIALQAKLGAKGFDADRFHEFVEGKRDNLLGPDDHLYTPAEQRLRALM